MTRPAADADIKAPRYADIDVVLRGLVGSTSVDTPLPARGTHLQRYARVFPCAEINSSSCAFDITASGAAMEHAWDLRQLLSETTSGL